MKHWKMQFTVASNSNKIECFEFEMIIENFSKFTDVSNSPAFTTTQKCKTVWEIIVEVTTRARKMRVALKRTDSNACNVKGSMYFEIRNDEKQICWQDSVEHHFTSKNIHCRFCDYIENASFLQHGKVFNSSSDRIIIKGLVLVKVLKSTCEHLKIDNFINENLDTLKNDYKSLYQNRTFSDVEIRLADGRLSAHKIILSSRSPVFKDMFEQDSSKKFIEETDVGRSMFENFLVFLYSGVIEDRDTANIACLYELAHKYKVHSLAKTCSSILTFEICVDTATRVLELAYKLEDSGLKEATINFTCKNFSQVAQKIEWGNFLKNHPRFASEVLKRVSKTLSRA